VSGLCLEIVEGPGAGHQVPLGEPLVIGRSQEAQLVLSDDQVSRRHARVSPRSADAVVEDLGSSNGTWLNGNELHMPAALAPGDELLVGVTVLQLRSLAQVEARPSAVRPVPPALAAAPPAPPQSAPLVQPGPPQAPGGELAALFDARTKRRAQLAPLAIFVLVALALLVYLAAK
jgi:pSer/pThr/pTyr-binding forkhead associated (FHA) protein